MSEHDQGGESGQAYDQTRDRRGDRGDRRKDPELEAPSREMAEKDRAATARLAARKTKDYLKHGGTERRGQNPGVGETGGPPSSGPKKGNGKF